LPVWAWASHPLITEDTGVLGEGRSQIELHGERARAGGMRTTESSVALSHGITGRTDFQVEVPLSGGDASLALKWRFLQQGRVQLLLKPQIDEQGRWGTSFVAGYDLGKLELLGHAGYLRNRNTPEERRSLRHLSMAALYAAGENFKLALDVARDTDPDPGSRASVRAIVFGLMYAASDDLDFGLGVKRGRSHPADERALLAGLKLRF
jgi:hypothetical protein